MWRTLARHLPTVADVVIQAIFPLCFTPEMYAGRPEFVDTLANFVRGPPGPTGTRSSSAQADAAHRARRTRGRCAEIEAPTLITFGAHDLVCSTPLRRAADQCAIGKSELVVFEHLSHCGLARGPRDVQPRRHSTSSCVRAPNSTRAGSRRPPAVATRALAGPARTERRHRITRQRPARPRQIGIDVSSGSAPTLHATPASSARPRIAVLGSAQGN